MATNPYALVNSMLVSAESYEGGDATCPGCKAEFVHCKGEVVLPYWRHSSAPKCSQEVYDRGVKLARKRGESLQHEAAKKWLCEQKPDFLVTCPGKHVRHVIATSKGEWKQEQTRVYDGRRLRIDVVTDDGLFIEVVHSSPCSDKKVEALNAAGVRWIEVEADSPSTIIAQHYDWNRCKRCWANEFARLELDEECWRRDIEYVGVVDWSRREKDSTARVLPITRRSGVHRHLHRSRQGAMLHMRSLPPHW
jgi:hypothetical protein